MSWTRSFVLGVALACMACSGPDSGASADDAALGDSATEATAVDATTDEVEPESGTWGWVSVIETNDFTDYIYVTMAGWYGGVRAYFATRPSWPRSYAGDLGFARVVSKAGACTLYDPGVMQDEGCEDCFCLDKGIECNGETFFDERWCETDEMCVWGPENPETWPDRGVCQALPAHFNVGTLTVEGPKLDLSLEPDDFDRYMQPDPEVEPELFDAGDAIEVRSLGGDLEPLSLSAAGVAHLEVPDRIVKVSLGEPATVSWVPADDEARIRLVLRVGSHDPYPVSGAIVCEAEDAAGSIEVDATLLEALFSLSCQGAYTLKPSVLFRYNRDVAAFPDGEVELFVASARGLQIVFD